jgi:peptidoglycan/LPS O-acetylase OafA/YrhL
MSIAIATRDARIDLLKLLCAQCIVLHHFSAYGPLSDGLELAMPQLSALLFDYGRMAVQVFLVVGGFLAVASFDSAKGIRSSALLRTVRQRYARLVVPMAVSLVLTVLVAAWARRWLDDDILSATPTLWQVLANLMLVQDIAGVGALSVGVWYVAIDFQLYALTALIFWFSQRRTQRGVTAKALIAALTMLSLYWFNLHPQWDAWAPYFFGAYGLGALAWWTQRSHRHTQAISALAVLALAALVVAFRGRMLLALGTSLLLGLRSGAWSQMQPAVGRWIARMSGASYALFLVHFAVLLVTNVLYQHWAMSSAVAIIAMGILGLLCSNLLALAFTRWVEAPLMRLVDRR